MDSPPHPLPDPNPDLLASGFDRIDRDLGLLVDCLAEVLVELGQTELARLVPWRHEAIPPSDGPLPAQLGLVYSIAFQLLNMVEENAAAVTRQRREELLGLCAERGHWGEQLGRLMAAGWSATRVAERLSQIEVEPVLTAHPTEAKRLSVLEQHRALRQWLEARSRNNDLPTLGQPARRELKAALERLWRTGEILLQKPSVDDERRNLLHYLRDVFPQVLPMVDRRLQGAWEDAGFDPNLLSSPTQLPRLRFGTWVGGDRDGHPGVTAEVTEATLLQLRANALVVLHRQLTALAERLPLAEWMQAPPARLLELRARLVDQLAEAASAPMGRHAGEPWRQCVELMLARLPVSVVPGQQPEVREGQGRYRHVHELAQDLGEIQASLTEVGAQRLADHDLAPVLRSLDVFGFHLARLDIRQNSAFHVKALTQLMSAADLDGSQWEEWSETERLRWLERELRSPRPFLHPDAVVGPEATAVLGCFRVLTRHLDLYGPAGLGALIVSMTRRTSDLLVVYLLAREAGLLRRYPEGMVCRLPVVPLFETADDLDRGPDIVRAFLEFPVTRTSLAFHAKRDGHPDRLLQQVMVGYSDSNKDAGILMSNWALQKAQSRLAATGAQAGVRVQFFHGRGGTISRGAGPTNRFLEALPNGSLSGSIRLTEQGETIDQKFGHPVTAAYHLELLLAGVTSTTLLHDTAHPQPHPLAPLMDRLARTSMTAYRALLESDGFLQFHRQATPIDALENARIGSRPSRRTGQPSLADLRAIPWVFSWTQARYYLTGWYGAGTALAALDDSDLEQLRTNLRRWPFLHYVLTNVESALASTDLGLMRAYAELVTDATVRERIWSLVEAEWSRTRAMLDRLRGSPIEARRPRFTRTIGLRAQALGILHQQQISLLRRWREWHAQGRQAEADSLLPEVLLSVNAIASGLRTTG